MGLVLIIYINQLMTLHFLPSSYIDNSLSCCATRKLSGKYIAAVHFSIELILMFLVSWPSYSRTNRVTLLVLIRNCKNSLSFLSKLLLYVLRTYVPIKYYFPQSICPSLLLCIFCGMDYSLHICGCLYFFIFIF